MGFLDDAINAVKDFTGGGDPTLKPEIILQSPESGTAFKARWVGNQITKEKKIGLFDSPRIKGTKVQDLGIKGSRYPLNIYFDGTDHQKVARDFWEKVDETGPWTIVHPLEGKKKNLFLLSVTWHNEPVRSANMTEFELSYIQGILPEAGKEFLAESVKKFSLDTIQGAIDQFFAIINLDNYEAFNAVFSAVNKSLNIIKKTLRRVENLQLLNPRIEALISGIGTTIASFPPDIERVAAQFSSLFEAVGLTQPDSIEGTNNYSNFAANLDDSDFIGANGTPANRNQIATLELNLTLGAVELARATLLDGVETRAQAIEQIELISAYFADLMSRLDSAQILFDDVNIEDQYISMSGAFDQCYKMLQKAIEYILSNTSNLLVERRFTIETDRSPLEIAWTELGGPGEYITLDDGLSIDQNYENFCRWNNLYGVDCMWLRRGTEVRIFS